MKFRALLLAGAAALAFSAPSMAQSASIEQRLDQMQKMIEAQQAQIEAQKSEISVLKKSLTTKKGKEASSITSVAVAPEPPPATPAVDSKLAAQQAQIDAINQKIEASDNAAKLAKQETPKWSLTGGRPAITSADGRFSLAIRALVQYDQAYYSQSANALSLAAANGPDLSSGGNFRRAWLGIQGKLFGDWGYYFNYDFGGANTETPGHIQNAAIEYTGFGPVTIRLGAIAASVGIEDATGSGDTVFLERNAPADAARNMMAGEARDAIAVVYSNDRLFGSIAYTGNKIQDSGAFDEQQGVVGRIAGLPFSSDEFKLLLSAGGAYAFKTSDIAAGPTGGGTITITASPEVTVDNTATKFVTSGPVAADTAWQVGLEAAAQWKGIYTQAGYFRYGVDLRSGGAYGFNGYYGQASYVLTGEDRPYNPATGAFGNPKPRIPFSLNGGGWGAWEVAARFSELNLNDNPGVAGVALPTGGLRGGDQKVWTFGVNWYPTSGLKFALQYENIDISRLGTIPAAGTKAAISNTSVGQNLNVIALRSQLTF